MFTNYKYKFKKLTLTSWSFFAVMCKLCNAFIITDILESNTSTKNTFCQADITCHRVATLLLKYILYNKFESSILCLTLEWFLWGLLQSKPSLHRLYAYKTIDNIEFDCPSKIKCRNSQKDF